MATVLFTWELGANLGHITSIKPIAHELRRRGHRVMAALRDLANAAKIFRGTGVELLPACFHHAAGNRRPTLTYAHLLANSGFTDVSTLSGHVAAWRNLIRLVNPDLIVIDHSPTALLAARCCDVPCVTLGTGFCVPPDEYPLRALLPGTTDSSDEDRVLDAVNIVLRGNRRPPLGRLAELFHEIEAHLLTTFPDLDHFGPRTEGEYFGPVCDNPGSAAGWPIGTGQRVFAYLRPFSALESLLTMLASRCLPTVAVVPTASQELQSKFRGTSVRVQSSSVDLPNAMRDASLSILHASHGATASSLVASCPTLLFPTQTEQYLLGRIVEGLGCGLIAPPSGIEAALERLLTETSFRVAAGTFAAKYADDVSQPQVQQITDRVESLLVAA